MTHWCDPFERLREADPAARRPEPASADGAMARAMYGEVVASRPTASTSRARRWRRVAVFVAAALATAAAAYVLTRPVTEPLTVACFRSANLTADRVILPASSDIPAGELCRVVWEPGGEFAAETGGRRPPLTACVLESGAVGVFPSRENGDVCQQLDAAKPDPTSIDDTQMVIELQDALVGQFLGSCLDLPAAAAVVERELDNRRLSDWEVTNAQPFTTDRPCASLAIDPATRTVELIPISP